MNILITGANGQLGNEMHRVSVSRRLKQSIITDIVELYRTNYAASVNVDKAVGLYFCVLDKIKLTFEVETPFWKDSLISCIEKLKV